MSVWMEAQAERDRAHAKHGDTSMESADPLDPEGVRRDIITEEWGEVAKEYNEARHERRQVDVVKLRAELIQMTAMTAAWADALTPLADTYRVEKPTRDLGFDQPDCDGRCDDGRAVCTFWHGPRPDTYRVEVEG